MTKVYGVQFKQLREGVLGDILDLVVAHVQDLDALHGRHWNLRHRGEVVVGEDPLVGVAVLIEGGGDDVDEAVVGHVEHRHVLGVAEDSLLDHLDQVVRDVDLGEVEVLEGFAPDLRDLVLGDVDRVDEAEVGKHLKVDTRQVVPRQVDGTNPEKPISSIHHTSSLGDASKYFTPRSSNYTSSQI